MVRSPTQQVCNNLMGSMSEHAVRARALYKALLKLHRGLPVQLQAVGDQYVKEEFRRHRQAKMEEAQIFLQEWTKYYVTLAKQLGTRRKQQTIGQDLSPEFWNNFADEQIGQLKELFDVTTTPMGSSGNR